MSAILHNPLELPAGLPAPVDDGAARHLVGLAWPDLVLPATDGSSVNLSRGRGRAIVYAYPRTGRPGQALPTAWHAIPGARGSTPQSSGFPPPFPALNRLRVAPLYAPSTQSPPH